MFQALFIDSYNIHGKLRSGVAPVLLLACTHVAFLFIHVPTAIVDRLLRNWGTDIYFDVGDDIPTMFMRNCVI